jgi:hypothetical protein
MNAVLNRAHTVTEENNIQLVYVVSKNATHTTARTTMNKVITIANNRMFATFTTAATFRDEQAETVSWWAD